MGRDSARVAGSGSAGRRVGGGAHETHDPHPRPIHRSGGDHRLLAREQRPRRGFPIAVKYAGVTGILLILFMVFIGRAAYQLAEVTTDRLINQRGISQAQQAAYQIDPFWADPARSPQALGDAQDRLELQLEGFLRNPGATGILDIVVLEQDREKFIANATGSHQVRLAGEEPLRVDEAERAGVMIRTGTVELEGQRKPARSYECAIFSDGRPAGFVRVFLSAEAIDELRDEVLSTVVLIILLAVVVGIPLVLVVGSFLTRPIRSLRRDMSIVAAGDLAHKSVIHTGDELETLAYAFNRMTAHLAEAQDQEARRQALERELAIATSIQTALLPDRIPKVAGYEVFPHYASAREVGGDYYDFIRLDDSAFGIVVADVSGKGVPGSLVMTMTRSLVRMAARDTSDLTEILSRVNGSLSRDMTRGMFVTLIYAHVDAAAGRVTIARAGHNPAYLYRSRERELVAVQPPGIALGMDRSDLFARTLKAQEFAIDAGDFLVLYTDGVIEAMDAEGREYSSERFAGVLTGSHGLGAREIVERVLADLKSHTRGAEPSDDVTLLVLKRR
ncbi:MAG: PP2C family protein-serine/threonine phosphatase [Planctomycetota bacterium]